MNIGTTINSFDGQPITCYQWSVEQPKAQLLIVHGMAEHGKRYERFAKFLNSLAISVMAYDQRGHGQTAGQASEVGFQEGGDFWENTLKDLDHLYNSLDQSTPTFLMGHSMGSFIVRAYASTNPHQLKGLVLSGTQGNPGPLLPIGKLVATLIGWIKGQGHLSNTLNKLSFGKFNTPFQPAKTEFDWLSRDAVEVQKYVDDPYCGHLVSAALWKGVLYGVGLVNQKSTFSQTDSALPIYLFAGDQDPVGSFGKGVKEVYENYKKAGVKDLSIRLYENARHEMLNETNREEVFQELGEWMQSRMG